MLFVSFHLCDVTLLLFTSDMNHKYNSAWAHITNSAVTWVFLLLPMVMKMKMKMVIMVMRMKMKMKISSYAS